MKKLLSVLLALCLLCATAVACADALSDLQARGTIIIACEGTYPPWNYEDENGQLTGYDIEVARAVCARLGLEPIFVTDLWDGLFAGLRSEQFDLVAASVEITEERALAFDFSTPYAYTRTVVIARGDTDITDIADLNGLTTCNTATSVYALLAEEYGATVLNVDDLAQTIELVTNGTCDATLNADTVYYDYMAAQPDADLVIAAYAPDVACIVFPFPKGDRYTTLREAVDGALAELAEEGVLSELSIKYFGGDLTIAP